MLATVLEWLTDFLTGAIMKSQIAARSKAVASPPCCWRCVKSHWSRILVPKQEVLEPRPFGLLVRRKAMGGIDLITVGWRKDEGIGACWHFLNTYDRSTSAIHTETLGDLIKFILTIHVYFYSISYINTHHPTIKFTSNYSGMQIFLLSRRQGVPQWRYHWYCSLILNLQTNISTFYAHHVASY